MTHTNQAHPAASFGMLKPVGHTVITFVSAQDMEDAALALSAQGFADSALARYTPSEMVSRVDEAIANASVLAPFGYELAIAKAHRVQAIDGCSFLVVHSPGQENVDRVAVIAKAHGAVSAQSYGTFLIQELTGLALGDAPVQ